MERLELFDRISGGVQRDIEGDLKVQRTDGVAEACGVPAERDPSFAGVDVVAVFVPASSDVEFVRLDETASNAPIPIAPFSLVQFSAISPHPTSCPSQLQDRPLSASTSSQLFSPVEHRSC